MVESGPIMGNIIDWLRQEARVIKSAPLSFLIFLSIGCIGGFWFSKQLSSGQADSLKSQIDAKNDQIGRYQVVLGIKPGSAGALVELNNQELALKTQSIVGKLREYSAEFDKKGEAINAQLAAKKITNEQAGRAHLDAAREVAKEFDGNLASDTYNVENELRSRLDSSALSHVLMVPGFLADRNPRTRVTFPDMARGSAVETMYLSRLADEMEQMAKLLPPDSAKQ